MAIIEGLWSSIARVFSPSTIVICIAAYLALRALYIAYFGPLSSLPGPFISRWTDIHLRFMVLSGNRAQYVNSLHQKYGSVVRISPRETDVSSPSALSTIHRATKPLFLKSAFYQVPPRFQSMFSTRDPSFHAGRRRLLGPCFTETALSEIDEVSELVRLAVRRMGEESRREGCTDVLKWWTMMAMDVIGQVSFGESFGLLQGGTKTQFAIDVASAGSILPLRTAFPTLVWLGAYLPWPWLNNIALSRQRMMGFQSQRVQHYLQQVKCGPPTADGKKTILGSLIKGSAGELNELDMTMETLSYITAGTDTTAVTLAYLIWTVCRHPNVQEKLVRELQNLPRQEELAYKDIRDLPYLNLVIEETLRLYGAVPGSLPRDVPAGGAQLEGYFIPDGTVVSTQAFSVHRDAEIFSEPERFDPSRWQNPSKATKDAFTAFGSGPRGCIGVHLARMELRLGAALFFRSFPNARVTEDCGMTDADMEQRISFLLFPKGGRCLIEVE